MSDTGKVRITCDGVGRYHLIAQGLPGEIVAATMAEAMAVAYGYARAQPKASAQNADT